MKRVVTTVGAVALVALFAAVPLAAKGGLERRVMFSERMLLTGPNTQAGTFVAAGAVNDAGSANAEFTVTPRKHNRGELRGTHVFTGSNGTITLKTVALVYPFPPPTPPRSFAQGRWWILGATGAYAGLEGRGKIFATADFTSGQVTILRPGKVRRD
jgi:hypothetical protein